MAKQKQDIESPAGYVIHKPDGAEKLPIKHYPSSGKLGDHSGKGNTIDGPCSEKGGYHK